MKMKHKLKNNKGNTFVSADDDLDVPQSSSETAPDSSLSGDDSPATTAAAAAAAGPSPKRRKSTEKRVVKVRIGESKGEQYPPSDSWSWRKYGQKPIKGSPFPRGYYRCSSAKGCPARKQIEICHVDPTLLLITYSFPHHNHPLPTKPHLSSAAAPPPPSSTVEDSTHNHNPLGSDVDPVGPAFLQGEEYSWISDVAFDSPAMVGPWWEDAEVAAVKEAEEEEELFGGLEELPECSAVFRKGRGGERCGFGGGATVCGGTG